MPDRISKTILLVDDEIIIAVAEKKLLESEGYHVLYAATGEEAVEIVCARNEPVDLILMDINLGPKMDGTQAARQILASNDIPILFLSSHTEKEIVEKTEEISFYGYVVKNSDPTVLFASINMVFKLHKAHAQLRESENRYRHLVEGSPDAVYIFSSKRGGVYYSPQVESVLGYTVEYLYAHPFLWNQSIHPDDLGRVSESIREFELGKPLDVEYRLRDAQGNWRWLHDRSIGRYEEQDEILIEGLATDVTARKQAESDLRESEKRYRTLVEMADDVIILTDLQGKHLFHNSAYYSSLGYEVGQEVDLDGFAIVHPDDLHIVRAGMAELSEKGVSVGEYRVRHRDGHWVRRYNKASLIRDSDGHPESILSIIRDITERKEAEEKLQRSEKLFRALIENSYDAITLLSRDGVVIYQSPSVTRLSGYTVEEAMKISPLVTVHPDDLTILEAAYSRFLSEPGAVGTLEFRSVRKDGTIWWTEATAMNLLDEPGVQAIVVNFRDITERKQIEEALRRKSEYLAALQETTLELLSQLDLDILLENIVRRAAALVGAPGGFLDLIDSQTGRLIPTVGLGVLSGSLEHEVRPGEGVAGMVWQTGQPLVINDYDSWPGHIFGYIPGQLSSTIGVPLLKNGRVMGVLGLGHSFSTHQTFDQDIVEILTQFARLAMLSIENARLFTTARQELAVRQLTEESLIKSEARLKTVTENTADIIMQVNQSGQITYINRLMPGLTKEEVIGSSIYKWVPEEQYSILTHTLREVFSTGEHGEYESLGPGPDGEARNYNVRVMPITVNGETISAIYTATDITAHKKVEETLRQSNQLLSMFIAHSPIYAFIKDVVPTESRVVYASDNYIDMVGIPGEKMVGKTMQELFPAEFAAKITADDWEVVSRGEVLKLDEDLNGRHFNTIKFPIKLGSRTLLAGYTIDITPRVQMEEALKQSLKEKEVLMQELQHRVKNSLMVAAGLLSLEERNLTDERARAIFANTQSRLHSMSAVYELLYRGGGIDRIDLRLYIQNLVQALAKSYNLQNGRVDFDMQLEEIHLDLKRTLPLGIILNELVTNALKYAFPGGKTPQGEPAIIRVELSRTDGQVKLCVADNGTGVSGETLHNGGMGLELVKMLARQIDGRFTIDGSHGCTACISFLE